MKKNYFPATPEMNKAEKAILDSMTLDMNLQDKVAEKLILDPFSPERLRLTAEFSSPTGVKKLLSTVPVRKPSKEIWFRTHPSADYRITAAALELKEDRETYLLVPELMFELSGEATVGKRLFTTSITRQGLVFMWPLRLPDSASRTDKWASSAMEAAELATKQWVRLVPNMSLGAYDIYTAQGQISEPEWPDVSFTDLMRMAFKDALIESRDHPVLRRLFGEI